MSKLYIPERHQTNDNDSQGGKGPSSNDEGKVLVFVNIDQQTLFNDHKFVIIVCIMKLRILRIEVSFCTGLENFGMVGCCLLLLRNPP